MNLYIKNVRLIDDEIDFVGSIYIKNGLIHKISNNLNEKIELGYDVIDGKELVLMPSFADLHCHFREPGYEYKEDIESGSKAAVKGGYTFVNAMANTNPICSNMEIVNYVQKRAEEVGLCNVHQCVSITENFDGVTLNHLEKLGEEVKCISDDGKGVQSPYIMYEALKLAKRKKLIVMLHEEEDSLKNHNMRLAEDLMTIRDIYLALQVDTNVHFCHVSTSSSMEAIIEGKQRSEKITCEVTPHHLALVDIDYKVNPPIRNYEDVNYLINAIKNGYVDAIGTDHAPHSIEDKAKGAPGISGIETSFPICYSTLVKGGHISINNLVSLMSTRPYEIMNINSGKLKAGYNGDLVLVDLNKSYVIDESQFLSKGKNTPFNGKEVYGEIQMTIKSGKIVYKK